MSSDISQITLPAQGSLTVNGIQQPSGPPKKKQCQGKGIKQNGMQNNAKKQCQHEFFYRGLCGQCGQEKSVLEKQGKLNLQTFGKFEGKAEVKETQLQQEHVNHLKQKRLQLILDLDHTLLNTALMSEVTQEQQHILNCKLADVENTPGQLLFRFDHMKLWTKLRPGVFEFLRDLSQIYEIHIYTNAESAYAKQMAKILDPQKKAFQRILSVEDSTRRLVKDLDVALGVEEIVLIVDDTMKVWPKHAQNILKIERYHYFPSSLRQFHKHGQALLENDRDEIAEYSSLGRIKVILEQIHKKFYDTNDMDTLLKKDVRHVLKQVMSSILVGEHALLSTAFSPEHDPFTTRILKELGATYTFEMQDNVTVLVGTQLRTEKAAWAAQRNIPIVTADWIYASKALWGKQQYRPFFIRPTHGQPQRQPSQHGQLAQNVGGNVQNQADGQQQQQQQQQQQSKIPGLGQGGGPQQQLQQQKQQQQLQQQPQQVVVDTEMKGMEVGGATVQKQRLKS